MKDWDAGLMWYPVQSGEGRILCQRLQSLHRALSDLLANLRKVTSHLMDTLSL